MAAKARFGVGFLGIRKMPLWTMSIVIGALFVAFAPNLLHVYGIHNDYEMLYFRTPGAFFHREANALFAIVRPVAALLTNFTMFPVDRLADFRWTRLFSLLTLCFLAAQLISIAIHDLRLRPAEALMIALATFLVPPFLYSVLNATAWAPHLLSIAVSFFAYALLSRSNLVAIPFGLLIANKEYGALFWQLLAYARLRLVWTSALIYQLALFDYPPNAFMFLLLPVCMLLFSRLPFTYRLSIALRDVAFLCLNVVFFSVVLKLLYLPIARLLVQVGAPDPEALDPITLRLAATYRVAFNLSPVDVFSRLCDLLKVAADLWFLPQWDARFVALAIIGAAFLISNLAIGQWRRRTDSHDLTTESFPLDRLSIRGRGVAILPMLIVGACVVLSGAPIWSSASGLVTYRTLVAPIVILSMLFLYSARGLVVMACQVSLTRPGRSAAVGGVAVFAILGAAEGANFLSNLQSMELARNEFAYAKGIVGQAESRNSSMIVIVDPRPFMLPEDLVAVRDQSGHAVPPYEMGCFSGYCLQTTAIFHIASQELGLAMDRFKIISQRAGVPVPGLTCAMVTDKSAGIPPAASHKTLLTMDWFHKQRNPTCIDYSIAWHDLSINLEK